MQNEILDIIIIGVLVSLFASTYRKRPSPIVRAWTLGWILILIHFTTNLFSPASDNLQAIQGVLSVSALIACAIVFLLAAVNQTESSDTRTPDLFLPFAAGASAILFLTLQAANIVARTPYLLLAAAGATAWLFYTVRLRQTSLPLRALLAISTAAHTAWIIWTILHNRPDVGVSALLSEFYLAVTLIQTGAFRRFSGGRLTVSVGLLAWAAVFPCAEFCDHLGLISRISPEFWNVPKYFVAFGMMLILLEEEIVSANNASKEYRVLFEANPHPMWIFDRNTQAFERVNDAALLQYGYQREDFLSMTLADLTASGQPVTSESTGFIQQHLKSDGSLCHVDIATHRMQSGGRDLAFSLVQDVTERQELHLRLSRQAHYDPLTGLANRAWLETKLRETLAHSARHGRRSALICLDIDRFKQINDTYGHGVGDLCLQEIARRLQQRARSMDVAARIGGEELSLLLHEIAEPHDAEEVAALILAALRVPIDASGYTIELTGSIGIALFPEDGADATTLWKNADSAMYRAKRAGGNQYLCMSPEIGLLTTEANEMEKCIRRAITGQGLEMHYQPLYKIDGQLDSLEALIRFRHPENGLIFPERFITIAEESGLIIPLGNWVLNEVCRQSAAWQREGLPPVRIALNISPLHLTRPDFAAHVLGALERHSVPAHMLGLEITETAMMRNVAEATRQIKLLADLGVLFSVDDFGTGYSSLGQLDNFAVHTLKIDRSFVARICRADGTYSIVDAIISMAHSLRLNVVAEGVETEEQWNCLRDLHCDTVQGYLLSKPHPAHEIPELLLENHPQRFKRRVVA